MILERLDIDADEFGAGRIRTTSQQKLVILDVPSAGVEPLVEGPG
jgi:sulfite reductase (ferredoxin)